MPGSLPTSVSSQVRALSPSGSVFQLQSLPALWSGPRVTPSDKISLRGEFRPIQGRHLRLPTQTLGRPSDSRCTCCPCFLLWFSKSPRPDRGPLSQVQEPLEGPQYTFGLMGTHAHLIRKRSTARMFPDPRKLEIYYLEAPFTLPPHS